mmetsp:Transcript_7748/g.19822  ORF Transcript_7748/g.19822 Transcript_7748/m.19822 type:complete len:286 (-) Transcript_7748:663-1520(-)
MSIATQLPPVFACARCAKTGKGAGKPAGLSKVILFFLQMLGEFLFLLEPLLPGLGAFRGLFVLVRLVLHRLDGLVVQVEAEEGARVESLLRLKGRVRVGSLGRGDEPVRVVDLGIDGAIPDRLCHDALRLLHAVEAKHVRNIFQGYPRVRFVRPPQPGADHVVLQPSNQVARLVLDELLLVLLVDLLECLEVPVPYGPGDVEVRLQCLPHAALSEVRPLGDLAKQQRHHRKPLVKRDPEPFCAGRGLPQSLLEAVLGLRVVQLDGADATHIVEVPAVLVHVPTVR